MTIPSYETLMTPLLDYLKDNKPRTSDEITKYLADKFELTPEEREERLASRKSTYIKNRAGWAAFYMKKAGLVFAPKRASIQITELGLKNAGSEINNKYLEQFPDFVEFKSGGNKKTVEIEINNIQEQTPEEDIERNYQKLRSQLADELLEQVRNSSPDFFEKMVVELIVAMGYGGTFNDATKATQRSNDGGIDGVIKEDRLGLDTIYIQAKKWDPKTTIGRPEIQKFAGALQGVRAKKGIFITTSYFSDGAIEFVNNIESKIILIDADKLSEYMIDYNIGVSVQQTYEIKRIDSDFFTDVN